MINWFKKQLTEFTAWAGLALMLSHVTPFWITIALGVLFIAIDDDKAKAWCLRVAPWLSKKVDDVSA